MLATVQRVSQAKIFVDKKIFSSIGLGCLVFVCVEKDDTSQSIKDMVSKILNFRMLDGPKGITTSALKDSSEEVLIVSQFTLVGKLLKGNRPSFENSKSPDIAKDMLNNIVKEFANHLTVKTGSFGAMMDVGLVNDGPATFVLNAKNGQLIDQAD